jgi:hypothetical protein
MPMVQDLILRCARHHSRHQKFVTFELPSSLLENPLQSFDYVQCDLAEEQLNNRMESSRGFKKN